MAKYLVTDRGTEYINKELTNFCTFKGIKHIPRTSHSPWTYGLVESQNKHLGRFIRSYLNPDTHDNWSLQANTYMYAHNSQPLTTLDISPLELLTHFKPRSGLTLDLNLARDIHRKCLATEDIFSNLPEHAHYSTHDLNPF